MHRGAAVDGAQGMNQKQIGELWFSFQPVPGAAYKLDAVSIGIGNFKGEKGSVISLLALEPKALVSR